MAKYRIQIHVGDVVQTLTEIEGAFTDPSPLMRDALLTMIRSTQLTFEAQGRPNPWDDLADSTIRKRFARARGARGGGQLGSLGTLGSIQILRDTGLLFQSVGGGANGPFATADGFGESDETSAIIGTNRPGADALQLGHSRGYFPPRVYLQILDQDEEDIVTMSADWFLQVGPYAA